MLKVLLRRQKDDAGFTLVELMIVILIIGILISIGLPTFLGARGRAQDRVAQATLRNALTAAKVFYTDFSAYYDTVSTTAFDQTNAEAIEPSIDFSGAAVGAVGISKASSTDPQAVLLTTVSASGWTFCLEDQATGSTPGIYYSRSATSSATGAAQACTFPATASTSITSWAHP